MIAAAGVSCDALDGGGQIAIALRDQARQPVDLIGRFGWRLDFNPAADAVEDGFGIERIGCGQHDVTFKTRVVIPGSLVALAPRNETLLSTLVGGFARGDLLDQFDDAAPELGIRDARERAGQRQTLRGRQKIGNVSRRGAFGEAFARGAARSSLEQKRDRDLKDFGDLLDAACSDPVGALLVFLNLLECKAQCFAEFFLTHTEHDAAHAHTTADIFVNRVGRFGRHFQHSLGSCLQDEAKRERSMPQAPIPSNLARKSLVTNAANLSNELTGSVLAPATACELQRRSVNSGFPALEISGDSRKKT